MTRDIQLSLKNLELRKATSIYDLSDDNLSEIFLRLPVRGVLCCQCVCKGFSKVITDPKFKGIHANGAITSNTTSFCSIFLVGRDMTDKLWCNVYVRFLYDHILLENTQRSTPFSHLRLSNPLSCKVCVVGSCNGLLCAKLEAPWDQDESYMLIWNPVTRENRFVAEPKIDGSSNEKLLALAFGFTPRTNDYKVVRVICYLKPKNVVNINLQVFSMSTDKWSTYPINTLQCREIDLMPLVDPLLVFGMIFTRNTRSLRGAFHWISEYPLPGRMDDRAVLSFGLEEEQLRLFTVLESDKIPHVKYGRLDLMNDSLSVIVPNYSSLYGNFDIWVMNEYGDRNSWIKQYTVNQFRGLASAPIGYWKDDLFLMPAR